MYRQLKNEPWAVVGFACRFNLSNLQARVLRELAHRKGERLVRYAERISKVRELVPWSLASRQARMSATAGRSGARLCVFFLCFRARIFLCCAVLWF